MTPILARFELTPYRQRIALALLTAAVVVSLAFALAGLTWRLAGHAGLGAITVPPAARPVPVPDIAPALALAPFGRAAPGDAAQPTTLALQLRGLVYAQPQTLAAAFISANGEQAKPFKVGDAVLAATIEGIEPRRVLLRNGGRVEFLTFPDPAALTGAATPAGGTAPGQNASQAMAPAAAPAAAATGPSSASPAEVLSRFDAQPVAGGYRVGANAPPGLRAGDVLRSVNGAALSSPDVAREAIMRAQSSGSAQIQITRDGKPVTITVPIR